MGENGNLRNFGGTYRHGTVFANQISVTETDNHTILLFQHWATITSGCQSYHYYEQLANSEAPDKMQYIITTPSNITVLLP